MRRLDDAVARLDDEFTAAHSEVDWQAMTTARNIGADPSGRYVAWWDYLSHAPASGCAGYRRHPGRVVVAAAPRPARRWDVSEMFVAHGTMEGILIHFEESLRTLPDGVPYLVYGSTYELVPSTEPTAPRWKPEPRWISESRPGCSRRRWRCRRPA